MLCRNSEEAIEQARVNANFTGKVWCYFSDTSGNWRVEKYDHRALTSWSGVVVHLVRPAAMTADDVRKILS